MTDRPILFSGPMVRALLAGRKTQTRRVVKPQPPTPEAFRGSLFGLDRAVADGVKLYSQNDYDRLPKHPTDWSLIGSVGVARTAGFPVRFRCPYGGPGDRLWVRETWCRADTPSGFAYCADTPEGSDQRGMGWRPSIHMPRAASRLTLEITDVRVERLQNISRDDAAAEGLVKLPASGRFVIEQGDQYFGSAAHDPREVYAHLWERINGKGSWAANPWVWAVTFEVETRP